MTGAPALRLTAPCPDSAVSPHPPLQDLRFSAAPEASAECTGAGVAAAAAEVSAPREGGCGGGVVGVQENAPSSRPSGLGRPLRRERSKHSLDERRGSQGPPCSEDS